MGLKAFGDRVIVQVDDVDNQTDGGLYLPTGVQLQGYVTGKVISFGQWTDGIAEGDRVIFDNVGIELDRDDKKLCVIKQDYIVAIEE